MDQHEPSTPGAHAALLLLHGSGGASQYWLSRFAPAMAQFGMAAYAPHYFDRTGTQRASAETILDGKHFPQWLAAATDAVSYIAARPGVDARKIARKNPVCSSGSGVYHILCREGGIRVTKWPPPTRLGLALISFAQTYAA